jgi:hypothetical protein
MKTIVEDNDEVENDCFENNDPQSNEANQGYEEEDFLVGEPCDSSGMSVMTASEKPTNQELMSNDKL